MELTTDQATYKTTKDQIEAIVTEMGQMPQECAERIMEVVCTYHVPLKWWSDLKQSDYLVSLYRKREQDG